MRQSRKTDEGNEKKLRNTLLYGERKDEKNIKQNKIDFEVKNQKMVLKIIII